MPPTFEYDFASNVFGFKGKSSFSTGLFINNEFVDSVSQETIDIITPVNGKTIGKTALANEKDVDVAVAAAKKAFETSWGLKVPALERGKLLFKLADLLEKNVDELAALEALDTGKPMKFARHVDLHYSMEYLRYYAGWADKMSGKVVETKDSKLTYTRYEPIGVCGLIVPWNFPIMNACWKLGPALATGNTVVYKPSEITPLTSLRLGELIKEAGFPPGVVNIVPGYGWTAGSAISSHMDIGKVSFTGSTNVGRQVMKAAAESNLKKVTLELGGKGPAVVLDDAHLEDALKWTAFGVMFNQGQICYACSRVYVHESVYDMFLSYYKHIMKSLPIGDPFSPTTFNGALASEAHFNRVMKYIEIGKKEGATLLAGGERWGTEGFYVKPTVFADVTPDMTLVKEEVFGPVVVVCKFKTEEELIKLANDSEFGLAAAVYSRDLTKAITTANAIQAGTVWVNMSGMPDPSMPFGGFKQSGIGRDFGEEALHGYVETKSVHINLTNKPPF